MKKGKLILLILTFVLCLPTLASAQAKRSQSKAKTTKKSGGCRSGEFPFPCPKGYKVLLNGNNPNNLFFAKDLKYGYGVYVIAPKDKFEESNLPDVIKTILKTLYPKDSQDYNWKDAEFYNKNAASKFEIGKKILLGFNGNRIVTIEYRNVVFKNKNLISGTVVEGFEPGEVARADFNDGVITSNGGCFDALKIIHLFTGEKDSDEIDPCTLEIKALS